MCGRYAQKEEPGVIAAFTGADVSHVEVLPPNFNVAPTHRVYVVDELSGDRALRIVSWGLIPQWAKDQSIASKLINARSDTIAEKPSFRTAFRQTRCLVPVSGWYEWQTTTTLETPVKQPYYFAPNQGNLLAFAGLLEAWKNSESGEWLRTMCVITVDANDDVAPVHDRMPAILLSDQWSDWLNPQIGSTSAEIESLKNALSPAPAGLVNRHAVSSRVNSVRNNDSELIAALS